MSPRRLTAVALTATALATGGCGSSSKSSNQTKSANQDASITPTTATAQAPTQSPATTGTIAAAELISKVDPICARLNAQRAAGRINTRAEYVSVTSKLSRREREAISEMIKLTPPASIANSWHQMLAGYRALSVNITKVSHEMAADEVDAAYKLLAMSLKIQEQTAAIARQAGFKDCGQIP